MIKEKYKLSIYANNNNSTQIGYRVLVIIKKEWTDDSIVYGNKGGDFDWPFTKTYYSQTIFLTGTRESALDVARELKTLLLKNDKIKLGKLNGLVINLTFNASELDTITEVVKLFEIKCQEYQPTSYEPVIVVLKGKHMDDHYILTDPEQAKRTFLNILTERYSRGYYNWMKDYKTSTKKPEATIQEIDVLPESLKDTKATLKLEWSSYVKEEREAESIRDEYTLIKEVVEKKLVDKAYPILSDRSNREYEIMEIIAPIIIK